jgi:toxin ParE1/3/4
MTYRIEFSKQADADLQGIFEYIALDLDSMQNAEEQLCRLEDRIMKLDHLPERFRKYSEEPWLSRGLRIMPVDNYCVFYIPDVLNGVTSIIRILYGGRDIDSVLRDHT